MITKQVLFRLDDSKLIAFDKKLSEKGISKQFFLSKCVELFLEDNLSFDNKGVTNDNNEIAELKKQIAIINERLSNLENDNKVIAFDTTIVNNELDNNDNSVIANDNVILSSPIQSQESEQKEDITENNTLPESSNLPVNEELGHNIPDTEGKPVNNNIVLSDDEIVDSESSTKTLPVDNENPYVKSFAVEVEAVTESKDTVNCDSKISTLKEALDNVILPELAKDKNMSHSAIAKLLEGKYLTSVAGKSTKWQGSLVKRALEYRKEYKV